MKELLARLSIILALTNDATFASLSEADQEKKINEEIKRLQAEAAKAATVATLTTERDALKAEIQTLKTEKEKLDKDAKIGTSATTELRNDVLRMYKVLNATPDETVLKTLQAADHTALLVFQKTYQTQMDDKFPGHCNECHSTDVSRNSTITEAPVKAGEEDKKKSGKALGNSDVASSFLQPQAEDFQQMHGGAPKKVEEKK